MKKISFAFVMLVVSIATSVQASEVNKAEINALVKAYIYNNPEVILDSLTKYEAVKKFEDVKESVRVYTPTIGNKNAKVIVVEYSEFECPFCKRVQGTMEKIRDKYKDRVLFAYKHLPLSFHKQAMPAALASQAAKNQGKFWEYSDKLWERQEFLGEKLYLDVAKELKLDMKKFNKDRKSTKFKAMIKQDLEDAQKVRAQGTPFFLINGEPLSGAQPEEAFVQAIEKALESVAN